MGKPARQMTRLTMARMAWLFLAKTPDSAAWCLARIDGWDGALITQADLSAIEYTIYEHSDDSRLPVDGNTAIPLTIADVIYDSLQTSDAWDVDTTGYNFALRLDGSSTPQFPNRKRRYSVCVLFTPFHGQAIEMRFMLDT